MRRDNTDIMALEKMETNTTSSNILTPRDPTLSRPSLGGVSPVVIRSVCISFGFAILGTKIYIYLARPPLFPLRSYSVAFSLSLFATLSSPPHWRRNSSHSGNSAVELESLYQHELDPLSSMLTEIETVVKLREVGVLSDEGFDLSVLKDGKRFGDEQYDITCLAVMWELARRYNTTYRTNKDGDFCFKSIAAWMLEAKWFAQAIIRDWSGHELLWLGEVEAPTLPLPEVPKREGCNDKQQIGLLSWMNKEAAYNVHLLVYYKIEDGQLYDYADLDCDIDWASDISSNEYEPFQSPASRIVIGPLYYNDDYGFGNQFLEDDASSSEYQYPLIYRTNSTETKESSRSDSPEVISMPEPPQPPEPWPGYYASVSEQRDRKAREITVYSWWRFLARSKQKPVDRVALSEGLDPKELYTHNTVVPEELERLKSIWGHTDEENDLEVDTGSSDNGPGVITPQNVAHHSPARILAANQTPSSTTGTPAPSSRKASAGYGTPPVLVGSEVVTGSSDDSPRVVTPQNVAHHSPARISAPAQTPPSSTGTPASSPRKARPDYSTSPFLVGTIPLSPPQSPSRMGRSTGRIDMTPLSPSQTPPPSRSQTPPRRSQSQKDEQSAKGTPPHSIDPPETPSQPPAQANEAQTPSPTSAAPSRDEQSAGLTPASAGLSQTPAQPPSPSPSPPLDEQTSSLTSVTPLNALQPLKDEEPGRDSLLSAGLSQMPAQAPSQPPSQSLDEHTPPPTGVTLQPRRDEQNGRVSPSPPGGPSQAPFQRHLLKKTSRRLLPQAGVGSYLKKKISNIERRLSRLSLKSGREHPDSTWADASESESQS